MDIIFEFALLFFYTNELLRDFLHFASYR